MHSKRAQRAASRQRVRDTSSRHSMRHKGRHDSVSRFRSKNDCTKKHKTKHEPYTPKEYDTEWIPASQIVYVNSRRRTSWPTSLPESLQWLTELCEVARTYTGAWLLNSTDVVNDMLSAYLDRRATTNNHAGQSFLIVLLLTLCVRVKETQYKFCQRIGLYTTFLCDILKGQYANFNFLNKINFGYEFNGAAIDTLVPLVHASFTQPYMPQFVHTKRHTSSGFTEIHIDIDRDNLPGYTNYRNHVEECAKEITKQWIDIGRDHAKLNLDLSKNIIYEPSVRNMVINCFSELFARDDLASQLSSLTKSASFLKSLVSRVVDDPAATPASYMILQLFIRNSIMTPDEVSHAIPDAWKGVRKYLTMRVNEPNRVPTASEKMHALSRVLLLTSMTHLDPHPADVTALTSYCHSEASKTADSILNVRIWHLVSRLSTRILGGNDLLTFRKHLPQFFVGLTSEEPPRPKKLEEHEEYIQMGFVDTFNNVHESDE